MGTGIFFTILTGMSFDDIQNLTFRLKKEEKSEITVDLKRLQQT